MGAPSAGGDGALPAHIGQDFVQLGPPLQRCIPAPAGTFLRLQMIVPSGTPTQGQASCRSRPPAGHDGLDTPGASHLRQGRLGAITLIRRCQGQRHRESAVGCDSQHPCPPMDVGLSRRAAILRALRALSHSLTGGQTRALPVRFGRQPQRPELQVCTASGRQGLGNFLFF